MTKEKIWLVEDEEDILALIYYNLEKEGFAATGFQSAEELFADKGKDLPNLIILDVMLPGMDGFQACRKLKEQELYACIPILMLTARSEESDIIAGLELGADDYLTKPFSPRVLIARVKALLRRVNGNAAKVRDKIVFGDFLIDNDRHEAFIEGRPVALTATEFRILALLAAKPGWVFSRDQIITAVHDGNISVTDRTVDVQIVSLRKKLGGHQSLIKTVRGVGYKLDER
ncbi:MAG: response regulator transcription factor [Proteobacteria bacterium]|nr:response regulator transcription factor [Pseudomonadota bacterium]MBU1708733.1 response regulator transcription factor [Pseudomonadota bacterium]